MGYTNYQFIDRVQQYSSEPMLKNYIIAKRAIGSGGFGSVFRLTHKKDNSYRALKVITITSENSSNVSALTKRKNKAWKEIVFVQQLNDCCNVVDIESAQQFELIDESGRLYGYDILILMEYLNGLQDLHSATDGLEKSCYWRELLTIDMGIAVCEALQAAQKNNEHFIHRDIKPENILWKYGKTGQNNKDILFKLCDFGIAIDKDYSKSTQGAGTYKYMSPERFSNQGIMDERIDIYGLGASMYVFFSGDFEEGFPIKGLFRTKEDRFEKPAGMSNELFMILNKSFEYEVGKRWDSVARFKQELINHKKRITKKGNHNAVTDKDGSNVQADHKKNKIAKWACYLCGLVFLMLVASNINAVTGYIEEIIPVEVSFEERFDKAVTLFNEGNYTQSLHLMKKADKESVASSGNESGEPAVLQFMDMIVPVVQERLNASGYNCGKVDSILGSRTIQSIKNYQKDKGLEITGSINEELLRSLDIIEK